MKRKFETLFITIFGQINQLLKNQNNNKNKVSKTHIGILKVKIKINCMNIIINTLRNITMKLISQQWMMF